jgi:hypothetical protein
MSRHARLGKCTTWDCIRSRVAVLLMPERCFSFMIARIVGTQPAADAISVSSWLFFLLASVDEVELCQIDTEERLDRDSLVLLFLVKAQNEDLPSVFQLYKLFYGEYLHVFLLSFRPHRSQTYPGLGKCTTWDYIKSRVAVLMPEWWCFYFILLRSRQSDPIPTPSPSKTCKRDIHVYGEW